MRFTIRVLVLAAAVGTSGCSAGQVMDGGSHVLDLFSQVPASSVYKSTTSVVDKANAREHDRQVEELNREYDEFVRSRGDSDTPSPSLSPVIVVPRNDEERRKLEENSPPE